MSAAAAAASPKFGPLAVDFEPSSFAGGSMFGAFGKSASFKSPITIKIVSFTREESGYVNYDIMVRRNCNSIYVYV
jgi:hypothetical protein